MPELARVMIANRGEIACRIIRTVRALGYRSVAAFSEADRDAPHVAQADQAVCIGPPAPRDSYLDIDRILEAAKKVGADAIHPGYGFLAENAELAARCAEADIVFIGPPAAAIRLMGDKARAKARMIEAGVPVIPGFQGDEQRFAAEAEGIGFPLLVKAVAGGGGRGMRIVREAGELSDALASARSEAESAFGNGDLLLERLIEQARHVEIQVFADAQGEAIHLGERECSAQRRHQKIIEESPSPAVDPDLRRRMGDAAVAAAKAIGYVNAGTVEFILGPDREFYFLEMNTRLQVEHPVTELVTGLDLVAWQLWIASGEPLPMAQEQVPMRGHAIEARIYAEDPDRGFLPQTGEVLHWRPETAGRPGVRIDGGIREGQEISAHYDSMLAKIIAGGETREIARRKLIAAIEDTPLLGLTTNRPFLVELLHDPTFVEGEVTTSYIDGREASPRPPGPELAALAAALVSLPSSETWRNSGETAWPVFLEREGERIEVRLTLRGEGYLARIGAEELLVEVIEVADHAVRCAVDGILQRATFARRDQELFLELGGRPARFTLPAASAARGEGGKADGRLTAPLSGQVVGVRVEVGQRVEPGQCVAVIEAMKMEHRIVASAAGEVTAVAVAEGDQVKTRQLIVEQALDDQDEE